MPKATKSKKLEPSKAAGKPYVLPIKFNPEERILLELLEKRRGIPRSILLKSYMREDAARLGIPLPAR
jgi:hypothetical protein